MSSERSLFQLAEPPAVFLNHGSYGTVPKAVAQYQRALLERVESHPDQWFREHSRVLLSESIDALEAFVNPPTKYSCVYVENATSGVNTIVQSFRWHTIVHFDTTYGAVKQTVKAESRRHGATIDCVSINFDHLSVSELLDRIRTCLEKNRAQPDDNRHGLLIVDHISSCPAFVFPVKKIIALAREYGFLVLVDGAHAIGQIHIDLTEMRPDFYVSNLHKWLYAPKSSAFLYVDQRFQSSVHPLFISHEYDTSFQREFYMVGTRDFTPYLCTPACLKFIQDTCGSADNMRRTINALLIKGVDLMQNAWKTKLMAELLDYSKDVSPEDSEMLLAAPFLATIELPFTYEAYLARYPDSTSGDMKINDGNDMLKVSHHKGYNVMKKLLEEYNIQTVVFDWQGRLWARVSAQVYNSLSDFEQLCSAISTIHNSL
jgi:selenocysteine lyase/cysteine desulfurase